MSPTDQWHSKSSRPSVLLAKSGMSRIGGDAIAPKLRTYSVTNSVERSRSSPNIRKQVRIAEEIELAGVRRVILVDTQHYVYYRINEAAKRIEILAVWSTKFGAPPPLSTT
jgi:hypothetical protein